MAIVPEGRRLLPDLTVEDNIRVATYALSSRRPRPGRQALELFPQLQQRLAALARTLSGGEQQMVVLAQALVSQPKFMLIDELSLGLAPVVVTRLIPVIRAIVESGIGVLLIEQFATVALGLADHAYVMEGGGIRYTARPANCATTPNCSVRLPAARQHRRTSPPPIPPPSGPPQAPPPNETRGSPGLGKRIPGFIL